MRLSQQQYFLLVAVLQRKEYLFTDHASTLRVRGISYR